MIAQEVGGTALKFALGAFALMIVFAIIANINRPHRFPDPPLTFSPSSQGATNTPMQTSYYRDNFVTFADESFRATGPARVRSLPTTRDSTVYSSLSAGELVTGRWVMGVDGASRWLRIDRNGSSPGYIWERNLARADTATQAPQDVSLDQANPVQTATPPQAAPSDPRPSRRREAATPIAQPEPGIVCVLPAGDEVRLSVQQCRLRSGVVLDQLQN